MNGHNAGREVVPFVRWSWRKRVKIDVSMTCRRANFTLVSVAISEDFPVSVQVALRHVLFLPHPHQVSAFRVGRICDVSIEHSFLFTHILSLIPKREDLPFWLQHATQFSFFTCWKKAKPWYRWLRIGSFIFWFSCLLHWPSRKEKGSCSFSRQ